MCSDKLPVPATIELGLTEEDLTDSLGYQKGLWLGAYTPEELFRDLKEFGIVDHLKSRGYTDLDPQLQCEPFRSVMKITGEHPEAKEPQLLIEVKARRTTERLISQLDDHDYSSLVLDWVLFQDPMAKFDPEHPQLPGQEHPGLQLLDLGSQLMMAHVRELEVDLVINYPRHFHNAVFYSPTFRFLEPTTEGHFQALFRDLDGHGDLGKASRALEKGAVRDGEGRPVFWQQKAQALAQDETIEERLFGELYQARVKRAAREVFHYSEESATEAV